MPANTDYLFSVPTRSGQYSVLTDGQSISPSYHFSSESSLGFYRSAASVLAASYGTFQLSGVSATGGIAASTLSSVGTVIGRGVWTSGLSVGGTSGYTGTAVQAISAISAAMPAMVVQGSASSFTIFVWPAVRANDWIGVTVGTGVGVSSLSSGLVFHSHCTQSGQCEVRISNVSTLVQNQSAQTLFFYRISV